MSLHYSLPELQSQLARMLTRERIQGWTSLPLCKRKETLRLISIIQLKKKQMSGNDNIVEVNWKEEYEKEHKLRQEAEAETILVKGIGMNSPEMRDEKKKGEAMTTEIKTLEARVKFLQDNLRGAVKLYKDEKERRQFAEKELGDLKKSIHDSDPVNKARNAGL